MNVPDDQVESTVRNLVLWTNVASMPLLAAVCWYAHLAAVRLPGQPWWRWITTAFLLAVARIWMGYFLQWERLPPWPWALVQAALFPVICGMLALSLRAAALNAVSQDQRERCLREKLSSLRTMLRGETEGV